MIRTLMTLILAGTLSFSAVTAPSTKAQDEARTTSTTMDSAESSPTEQEEQTYDGCDEIVMDGPILVWKGTTFQIISHVNWPSKTGHYELWDESGTKLLDLDQATTATITSTISIPSNYTEDHADYLILIQGYRADGSMIPHPYCEENHIYSIRTLIGLLFLPLTLNND